MSIEAEAADHERVEVAREEVGEIEGRGLGVVDLLPLGVPGEEAVAVRARQALDAVSLEHEVERAPGAAVGVGDEHPLVAPVQLAQLRVDRGRDQLGTRVELRRKAADGDVAPPVQANHREHFASDRAAGEHEHLGALGLEDALLVRPQ